MSLGTLFFEVGLEFFCFELFGPVIVLNLLLTLTDSFLRLLLLCVLEWTRRGLFLRVGELREWQGV